MDTDNPKDDEELKIIRKPVPDHDHDHGEDRSDECDEANSSGQ
jgi:hypothetical protein